MSFSNLLFFFQNKMKSLLIKYLWNFILIYINNIIIYFQSLNEYLNHLDLVLQALQNIEIILSLQKYYFKYKNLKLLKYHISQLEIIMQKKKIATVMILLFSNKFKYLESDFKLFNYYYNFIFFFTILIDFLFRLKILLLKNIFSQSRLRKIYISIKKIIEKNFNLLDIIKKI